MLNKDSKLYIGAAYYPEVWPLANIDADIAQMKQCGCNVMRIGEFAWHAMEPEEGVYTLDWIAHVMDKLHAAGIHVILCTPSATPPQWLVNKYNEVLAMNDTGVRSQHGARRHTCPNSPTGREYNRRINVALAKRFGSHPALIGWQIDNELHFFEGRGCHCPICVERFRSYLKGIYRDIAVLNEKWGMARWSLTYENFDRIIPPRKDTWNHPSLVMYWDYFMSDSYTSFCDEQVDVLRQYSAAPVGTDMMPYMDLSYTAIHKKLDMVQYNHYDDAGNIHRQTFWMDYIRTIKDTPFWVTETQSGWNGSVAASPCRPDGYGRMNSWMAIAQGAEMNCYWLWKAHPHGHELMHGAVVSSSGRLNHPSREIMRLSTELESCEDFLTSTKVAPKAAMHFTHASHITLKAIPRMWNFNYADRLRDEFYLPITQKYHVGLDVIDSDKALDSYKVIFSPYLVTLDTATLDRRMTDWVRDGGTWVVGPHSDVIDRHGSHYTHSPFGILEELTGIRCEYQIPSDSREFNLKWADGTITKGRSSYDGFVCEGAQALATYDGGSLDALAANLCVNYGSGRIIILGTVPDDAAMAKILKLCGLGGYDASPNVFAVDREGNGKSGVIALELRGESGYINLEGCYTDLINGASVSGKLEIEPYGVYVLEKARE